MVTTRKLTADDFAVLGDLAAHRIERVPHDTNPPRFYRDGVDVTTEVRSLSAGCLVFLHRWPDVLGDRGREALADPGSVLMTPAEESVYEAEQAVADDDDGDTEMSYRPVAANGCWMILDGLGMAALLGMFGPGAISELYVAMMRDGRQVGDETRVELRVTQISAGFAMAMARFDNPDQRPFDQFRAEVVHNGAVLDTVAYAQYSVTGEG